MSIALNPRLSAFSDLPDEAVLSVKEITMLSGRSRTSLWRDVREGRLVEPIKFGRNCVKWQVKHVRAFLCGNGGVQNGH